MSIELIVEVMDHAPAELTPGERYALIVLAEDARMPSREVWHDITDDYLLRRLRLSPRSWLNMRGELVKKKALEKIDGGHNGKRARYRIPVLDPAMKGHPNGDPTDEDEPELGHRSGDPTAGKGHRSGDPTDPKGHRSGDSRVTDPVTLGLYIPRTTPPPPPGQVVEAEEAGAAPNPDAVAIIGKLDLRRPLTGTEHDALLDHVTTALHAGWTVPDLLAVLNRDWTGANDRVRTAIGRARDLGRPPLATARASPDAGTAPPWCGKCGDNPDAARVNPKFRTVDGPDGARTPCPDCHPTAGGPRP